MNRQGLGLLAGAIGAALVLAGCQPGSTPLAKSGASGAAPGVVTMAQDIESPGVFNLTGEGLWDGRPSLGGVWVAHSSVRDPERVLIRNEKNGRTVVGALFRRERENPGPSVQVSSDAAEALGMLAGQPAQLAVVALRRQETDVSDEAEVTPEVEAAAAAEAQAAPAPATDAPAATGAAPTAAIAASTDGSEPAADASALAADGSAPAEAAAAEPKKKRGLFGGLFKRKPKVEAGVPADVATAPIADAATGGPIEAAPLDPVVGTAAAGIAAAEAKKAAAEPALKRAYVQIGIFSTEANAERAVTQMKGAGMTANVVSDQSNGKTYWRVIVGPAASVAERDGLATKVKGLGYPDAYPVSK